MMETKTKVIITIISSCLIIVSVVGFCLGWFGKKRAVSLDLDSMKGEVDIGRAAQYRRSEPFHQYPLRELEPPADCSDGSGGSFRPSGQWIFRCGSGS